MVVQGHLFWLLLSDQRNPLGPASATEQIPRVDLDYFLSSSRWNNDPTDSCLQKHCVNKAITMKTRFVFSASQVIETSLAMISYNRV